MNARVKLSCVFFFTLLVLSTIQVTEGRSQYQSSKNYRNNRAISQVMYVEFTDAYYDDLDSDGQEDDIRLEFNLILTNFTEGQFEVGITLFLVVKLITPTNNKFTHRLVFDAFESEMQFKLDLLNHAFDNGWYIAIIKVFNLDFRCVYPTMDLVVFDPPGGKPGGDPRLMGVIIGKSGAITVITS